MKIMRLDGEVIAEYSGSLKESLENLNSQGISLREVALTAKELKGVNLKDAYLQCAHCDYSNLRNADFRGADLDGANFEKANLQNADFRGASLKFADFSEANILGTKFDAQIPKVEKLHSRLLEVDVDMFTWHTCDTTHCRAGWAIHLAGEEGYALERKYGPNVAGALITINSCPELNGQVPNWFATDKEARTDIARLAEME